MHVLRVHTSRMRVLHIYMHFHVLPIWLNKGWWWWWWNCWFEDEKSVAALRSAMSVKWDCESVAEWVSERSSVLSFARSLSVSVQFDVRAHSLLPLRVSLALSVLTHSAVCRSLVTPLSLDAALDDSSCFRQLPQPASGVVSLKASRWGLALWCRRRRVQTLFRFTGH